MSYRVAPEGLAALSFVRVTTAFNIYVRSAPFFMSTILFHLALSSTLILLLSHSMLYEIYLYYETRKAIIDRLVILKSAIQLIKITMLKHYFTFLLKFRVVRF